MSEEMAVSDNPTGEESVVNGGEASTASAEDAAPAAPEPPSAPLDPEPEDIKPTIADLEPSSSEAPKGTEEEEPIDDKRGIKRRASSAFLEIEVENFRGFEKFELDDSTVEYERIVEHLEEEVAEANKIAAPLRTVMGSPLAPVKASKRPRQDTDGSRPSSALSSRSDGDGTVSSTEQVGSSPAARGRRATTEMSSPLLRVPLERGWKRELVYRAALDQHSRRNADIYYYTPQGKKLRSTREVSEQLSGTGLTLENFSFFKESLGVDDPEKEIIRDAKMMRRVESPVAQAAPPAEGKRTPKPKQPKGASPEPATPKSPPAKLKVKSVGSRLSGTPTPTPPAKLKKPLPATDNNNTAAWKKNRTASAPAPVPASAPAPAPPPPPPPPPLQSRPPVSPEQTKVVQLDQSSPRQLVQPCSMTCGRGVPTLACSACLCLYHPACAGHSMTSHTFFCKNCRKSSSPPPEPPPLVHKSGAAPAPQPAPVPRRAAPATLPVPVPVPRPRPAPDKRVLLRMKVAGGGPGGERVWAVAPAPRPVLRPALPQSIAILNGRRFIVVPRN